MAQNTASADYSGSGTLNIGQAFGGNYFSGNLETNTANRNADYQAFQTNQALRSVAMSFSKFDLYPLSAGGSTARPARKTTR